MDGELITSTAKSERENAVLTGQLFERMMAYYSVPRLRRQLAKIKFHERGEAPWIPQSRERDFVFLLSALRDFDGYAASEQALAELGPLLGKYLLFLESHGISITQFLNRSAKSWEEIGPKFQDITRSALSQALFRHFPALPQDLADSVTSFLLVNCLARVVPSFPFRKEAGSSPIILLRAKADMAWSALLSRRDLLGPLEFHLPEINWQGNAFQERRVWYMGVLVLSPLTQRTKDVLERALETRVHQFSSLVKSRKRLVYLAFASENDMNVVRFNLNHFGKMTATYFEPFAATGPEFREGYPGMSGFIEEEFRTATNTGSR